jgi:hypothetical protein
MDSSPYPYLDALIMRLRQFPEVEALLLVDSDAPQPPMPSPPPLFIPDAELTEQLRLVQLTNWMRENQVAGGDATIQGARAMLQATLTAHDIAAVFGECGPIQISEADVVTLAEEGLARLVKLHDAVIGHIISRMILTNDQFRQFIEVERALQPYLVQLQLRQN